VKLGVQEGGPYDSKGKEQKKRLFKSLGRKKEASREHPTPAESRTRINWVYSGNIPVQSDEEDREGIREKVD